MRNTLAALSNERYVLLTSYRRNGAGVATAVWIGRDADRVLVTTAAELGKVNRIRHTPRVTLQPCDIRGRVLAGSESIDATAVIDTTAATRAVLDRVFRSKYGWQYRIMRRFGRRASGDPVAIVLS